MKSKLKKFSHFLEIAVGAFLANYLFNAIFLKKLLDNNKNLFDLSCAIPFKYISKNYNFEIVGLIFVLLIILAFLILIQFKLTKLEKIAIEKQQAEKIK